MAAPDSQSTVREVTADDYRRLFATMPTVFDTVDFALLNAAKCRRVAFVEGGGCGMVLGLGDDGVWRAPFSAPYASMTGAGDAASFLDGLLAFTGGRLALTLPPPIYGGGAFAEALAARGLVSLHEYNYHYDLSHFADFEAGLSSLARRNLRRARRNDFSLSLTSDLDAVYAFIAEHHRRLGYRMAMALEQVRDTLRVVPADLFVLTLDGAVAAAGIFFHTAPGVVQLINWGDDTSLRDLRTMNFMAWAVLQHYAADGVTRIVDLGPASTDGVKNDGLVRFKLSLGCTESLKPRLLGSNNVS